jgi:hypothetical protein
MSFFVGNPPRQMQIFTGVALCNKESDGRTEHEEVIVRLGAMTTDFFEFTAKADLASITNDDSEFIFAVDESWVISNKVTKELELHVMVGVQGNISEILRFSYHVQVLSDPLDTMLAGSIRWRETLGDPTIAALSGTVSMFHVDIGSDVQDPGPTGPLGGATHFQVIRSGFSVGIPVRADGFWAIAYQIHDVPLGPSFAVRPTLLPNLFLGPPPGFQRLSPGFTPARNVQLSPAVPSEVGVDFEMTFPEDPR